jgi:hypothetical protein
MDERLELLSQELLPISVDLRRYRVAVTAVTAARRTTMEFELGGHAFSQRMCEFIALVAPSQAAGSTTAYCHAFGSFIEHCKETGYRTVTGESFASYINWTKTARTRRRRTLYFEGTRQTYSSHLLAFMDWLATLGDMSLNEVFAARSRHKKAFRGIGARLLQLSWLKAVSPDEFIRLTRAIRLEFESCKRILEQPTSEQKKYQVTFPLLPFSMLLGTELAVRAVEFNHLRIRDVRGDRLLLNPPNKDPSEVWLSPSLMSALELAQQWMARYRTKCAPDEPLLAFPMWKGPRAKQIVPFDTILLLVSLNRFYEKYFDLSAPDGAPYLYADPQADESSLKHFSLSFKDFRSAAITEAARHERNPARVQRFARHKHFSTTLRFYVRETHKRWISNVAKSLAPSAELIRISLENRVASRQEETAAESASAAVLGGHCEQALAGDRSCKRATDCRFCAFFRIHVSKRSFFLKEMEDSVLQADFLQNTQGLLRDAQNLREFAALNQAIIDRIDEHLDDTRTDVAA